MTVHTPTVFCENVATTLSTYANISATTVTTAIATTTSITTATESITSGKFKMLPHPGNISPYS